MDPLWLQTVMLLGVTSDAGMTDNESVLVVNAGSSSLKMQLVPERVHVNIERIGTAVRDHGEAFRLALPRLRQQAQGATIVACGHRVVHGGEQFRESVVIDEKVLATVIRLGSIAPLHNPPGVEGIRAARQALPDIPHVAVFDTAFHAGLEPRSFLTGLPWEYYEQKGIRNYGFHGTNHDHVTRQAAEILGRPREELRLVSLHLGNGASAAAIKGGRSVDTSMGFTPLAGLLMGTRTGDLDPGIILHLLSEGMQLAELTELLNRQSGLKGLSGRTNDMRDLRSAAVAGDVRSRHAIDVYVHRIRKAIGAEAAVMDGLDAIIFTGGVGENDSRVREEILKGMEWLGVELDPELNRSHSSIITKAGSAVTVLVVAADEEGLIASETVRVARDAGAKW